MNGDRALTRHVLLLYSLEEVYVEDDAQHALEQTDLRAQTEGQEHQEEDARPERRARQFHDRLRKHDESQPGALGGLEEKRDRRFESQTRRGTLDPRFM